MHQQAVARNGWARRLSIAAALVAAWFVWEVVDEHAQNDPWVAGIIVVSAVAGAAGAYWLQDRRSEKLRRAEQRRLHEQTGEYTPVAFEDPRFVPDRSWVAPVAIVCVAAVWGLSAGLRARDNYIRPYCLYGTRSQAQFDGCMKHVRANDIDRLDTQAARFARGETSECLEDAGPFCADAAKWNGYEPPGPAE